MNRMLIYILQSNHPLFSEKEKIFKRKKKNISYFLEMDGKGDISLLTEVSNVTNCYLNIVKCYQ